MNAEEAEEIVENIYTYARMLVDYQVVDLSSDPNDNHILLQLEMEPGKVDLIVSGDRIRTLAFEEVQGIPIVTAREAVELISHGKIVLHRSTRQSMSDLVS